MHSLNKGKRAEREAAAALESVLGVECRRSQQYAGGMGSADVVGLDGVHVEVKHQERMRLFDWITQAVGDCGTNVPIVLHRQNRKPWVVSMLLSDVPQFADKIAKNETITNHTLRPVEGMANANEDQRRGTEHQTTGGNT